jgi:phosphatidylethanolamine/phosphatidyl-N-methylethanolamine N-methyltransferase
MPHHPRRRLHDYKKNEHVLFFKRLIKNPKALGAIMPSSKALAAMVAQHVDMEQESYVVEVGAGTGSFTRALLDAGLTPERLIVVELDAELCAYLHEQFPNITVLRGDATLLHKLLPSKVIGHTATIISGIPLINLNTSDQSKLIEAFKSVMSPHGNIIQFTYGPLSPLPHKKFGLKAKRLGFVLRNVPPATVWSFTAAGKHNETPVDLSPFNKAHLRVKRTLSWIRQTVQPRP